MSLKVTEELITRQPPEAQAIIRALLAKIQELQDQLNQSPRNSSAVRSGQPTAPQLLWLRGWEGGGAVHGWSAHPRAVRYTGRCVLRAERFAQAAEERESLRRLQA